jgi:hypothetical protein
MVQKQCVEHVLVFSASSCFFKRLRGLQDSNMYLRAAVEPPGCTNVDDVPYSTDTVRRDKCERVLCPLTHHQ